MAKKKQELSPEERLVAALVPEEEQPYELPEGWRWIMVKGLCTLNNGKAFKPKDWKNSGIPIVRIQNLNDRKAIYHYYDGDIEDRFRLHGDELLFAWSGTPGTSFGAHIWHGKEAVLNQHIFRVDFDDKFLDKKFFKYALNQQLTLLINKAHGGAGLQHVTKKVMESTPICVPPFSEQQRIVARIESLFAKLDAAKEKVQSVLDAHEARKAALLHAAFAGKMTKEWRANRNISYDDWRLVSIQDICHSLKYGTAKKSESSGRYVVIRMGNLFDGEIIWENLAYSNDEDDIKKYRLSPGDVLFNRTNSAALVGKTSIYRGEYPAIYAGYIIKLDYDREIVVGEFLNYVMNSVQAKVYCNKVKTDGVNQSNINAKKISAFQFRLPTFSEQQEIVRILNKLLGREACVKQSAESVLESIDRMKQSILARAFRGEL